MNKKQCINLVAQYLKEGCKVQVEYNVKDKQYFCYCPSGWYKPNDGCIIVAFFMGEFTKKEIRENLTRKLKEMLYIYENNKN